MATMKEAITGLSCLSAGRFVHGVEMQSQGMSARQSALGLFPLPSPLWCSVFGRKRCEKENRTFLNSTIQAPKSDFFFS
jgi:hypothetical protein